jgi:hypothetical protein
MKKLSFGSEDSRVLLTKTHSFLIAAYLNHLNLGLPPFEIECIDTSGYMFGKHFVVRMTMRKCQLCKWFHRISAENTKLKTIKV